MQVETSRIFDLTDINDYIELDLTHSIHTSERRSFRGCRRRWDWLFRQYYYPVTTPKYFEFGIAYHKGMETFYEPKYWGVPRETVLELAVQVFRKRCKEQFRKFKDYHGSPDPETVQDYKDRMQLGEGMLRHHGEKVYPEIREEYRPLKVEVSFEVPIPNVDAAGEIVGETKWCRCKVCWGRFKQHLTTNGYDAFRTADEGYISAAQLRTAVTEKYFLERWRGLPVTYGGRIDCVMESVDDSSIWIFDWKTTASLSEDRLEFLELDDQISSYVWALRRLGIDVSGFVYFEMRKAYSEELEPMKVMRLGRRFSVSKNLAIDAETYEQVVSENDAEAYATGLYDEHIAWLKDHGGRFHASYPVYRNEIQNVQTELMIAREAADILNPNLLIYPNAGRFNCGNCAFKQPCLSVNDGGDHQYSLDTQFEKRRYHYWIDKEPSTESKGNE